VVWRVALADEFEPEFTELPKAVQMEILALARLLQHFGPQLGRPRVDTLANSRHANMKELRFSAADGEWRVAFAFDPQRQAILLAAGDKSGGSNKRFYRELIRKADLRFAAHLAGLKRDKK
jgi:hypothetical protein